LQLKLLLPREEKYSAVVRQVVSRRAAIENALHSSPTKTETGSEF
jgi:hypothetical protein